MIVNGRPVFDFGLDAHRDFTVRTYRPEQEELEIDVVIHDDGAAVRWLAEPAEGDAGQVLAPATDAAEEKSARSPAPPSLAVRWLHDQRGRMRSGSWAGPLGEATSGPRASWRDGAPRRVPPAVSSGWTPRPAPSRPNGGVASPSGPRELA